MLQAIVATPLLSGAANNDRSDPMKSFASNLESTRVPANAIALFWLEQNHFVIKTPKGEVIHIDPFLSRTMKPEIFIHPKPVVAPAKAKADYVFMTHDHRDHADPDTIGPMAEANPRCRFIGTPEACARALTVGVIGELLTEIRDGEELEFGDFKVRGVYAENTSERDATTHLGLVFDFGGLVVYDTGDTRKDPDQYIARLAPVKGLRPDAMLVAINEGYNNPGLAGAKRLVEWADPRLIVPCHYDCFKHNTIDPRQFVEALPAERRASVKIMSRGERIVIQRGGPDRS